MGKKLKINENKINGGRIAEVRELAVPKHNKDKQ